MGLRMPRKYSTWAPSGSAVHADPGEMGGEVEPALLARDAAGLRLFVGQVQALVAGEVVDPVQLAGMDAQDVLHELQGFADRTRHAAVLLGHEGLLHPIQVPVIEAVRIDEAAADERADEVESEGGAFVAAQHQLGIGSAGRLREVGTIDEVAAIAGEGDAVAGLEIVGAGLGVLAGDAADADQALAAAVREHQADLQQDFELVGDGGGIAVVETLGAVAALEQETLAAGGFGQLGLEGADLPGGD